MDNKQQKKDNLENQFQELVDKAKQLYPNIDDAIVTLNNMTAKTMDLQNYLNLTTQTPAETSNNHVSLI